MTFGVKVELALSVLRRKLFGIKREEPIYIFSYHKVGSKLTTKIFHRVSLKYGWKFGSFAGEVKEIPSEYDVLTFRHSQVDLKKHSKPFIGVHFIRDPRDIIVSGYLFHRRTMEKWCVNKDFSKASPIVYPRVPFSQEWRSEEWKSNYLDSLNGKSYQEILQGLSQKEGLRYEMQHYGRWTIEDMMKWDYNNPNVLELKFEDFMMNMEASVTEMLNFCKFDEKQVSLGLKLIEGEDPSKMTDEEIKNNLHISSRNPSKWRKYFDDDLKKEFIEMFGDVLIDLGYEKDHNW